MRPRTYQDTKVETFIEDVKGCIWIGPLWKFTGAQRIFGGKAIEFRWNSMIGNMHIRHAVSTVEIEQIVDTWWLISGIQHKIKKDIEKLIN